jgi:hypothetical protein
MHIFALARELRPKVDQVRGDSHNLLRHSVIHRQKKTTFFMPIAYATLRNFTLLYAALRYSTLRYSTLLYSTLLYTTLRYSTLPYATLRYPTLL